MPRQRALHGMEDELVDRARIAETHFDFRRMHVHIDAFRRQIEKQHIRRIAVAVQHVFVSGAHGVRQQLVAHEAAIDEEILLVGAAAARGRQAGAAVDGQRPGRFVERQMGRGKGLAQDLGDARGRIAGVPVFDRAAVMQHRNRHVRPRQRGAANHLEAMAEFGLLALQEFAARGRVEVQLAHFDRRALGAGRRAQHAGLRVDAHGMRRVGGAARDEHLRHRRNRRQRLAAKPERADRFEFGERADLAGRVAHQREREFGFGDAAAVVGDRDAFDAAFVEQDAQRLRAGVERVLQQFLNDRGRPFDHLAGGNLADQQVGKGLDGPQRA